METIIMATCQATGADLFDKVKTGCSLPTKAETSCGCKTQKSSCGCGCGGHAKNGTMEKTGKIIDKLTKQPLIGAHIMNVETQQGAVSDENGNFVLEAANDELIKVSFVGMKDVTLPASQIEAVEMEEDSLLDEVVVSTKKSFKKNTGLWVGVGLVALYAYAKTRKPKRSTTSKKPVANG
ncbi:carboxypeptidase-like regulatory domain-containing protein [Tenacibaculum caenipelagi]|uniref:Carboxypeptidase-like protein n=1 Tax=Tenacibaculum caenipelagi TaxID=1325435 RepID=A0A4R6TAE9_9FLAO|nr:carboxypeptidase-like regulatory domain-containing protein [Tenacibaculum caenipelagi]TDQ22748.1 carboxypeptidase-like protein [Tenacibaculum caenipelagi]